MANELFNRDAIRIGDALYRPQDRAIRCGGLEQRLEPKQAGVLELLVENAGKVVTRGELLDDVWGDEGSDEALTQAISRLRQSLGNRALIRTEPGQGYRLTVDTVATVEAAPTERQPVSEANSRPHLDSRALKIAFGLGLASGLLLSLLAALAFWPRSVTITEEISQPVDGPPTTRRTECEGSPEECGVIIPPQS